MNKVLVTGGAGFVGSSLAMGIKARNPGTQVLALDNLKRRGSELNLPRLRDAGVDFAHGDIRNPADLEAIHEIDTIVECSAEPSVLAGYGASPAYVTDTNLVGTINCLELARRTGAATLFLSTSRIYPFDALNDLPFTEDETRFVWSPEQELTAVSAAGVSEEFPLDGPRTMYGATKLCSEIMLHEYRNMYGLKGLINRCSVIAGPWQMGKVDQGVLGLWAARHIYGGALSYIGFGGSGKQVRDFFHVEDVLDLVLYELEHMDELDGETFNAGGGPDNSASLIELTARCREISGTTIEIGADLEDRPGDVRLYMTNNAKVTAKTGWRPQRNLETILTDIVDWLRTNETALKPILQ